MGGILDGFQEEERRYAQWVAKERQKERAIEEFLDEIAEVATADLAAFGIASRREIDMVVFARGRVDLVTLIGAWNDLGKCPEVVARMTVYDPLVARNPDIKAPAERSIQKRGAYLPEIGKAARAAWQAYEDNLPEFRELGLA